MSDPRKAALEAQLAMLPPEKRAALLERLAKKNEAAGGGAAMPDLALTRAPREPAPPVSFAQQRLWFLEQFLPGTATYNVPDARTLRGSLDRAALVKALDDLVARHEVLRTTFKLVSGEPVQDIHPPSAMPLDVVDFSTTADAAEREREARRVLVEAAERPFDLAKGPVVRATLVVLEPQHHVLMINVHHIATDAWSNGVLWGDLWTLYRAHHRGEQPALAPLEIQYADFAVWQREWLKGAREQQQLAYWKSALENIAPLELPTSRPRPPVMNNRGGHIQTTLHRETVARLEEVARGEGATLFMVLLSAFAALMHRYSQQEDIAIGAPIANRRRAEVEPLIGFFVNTLVLRMNLGGAPTMREVIRRARTTSLDAYAHQDLPFERLVEALVPQRDLSRTPLIQVMLALGNTPQAREDIEGLSLEPYSVSARTAKFDLSAELAPTTNGDLVASWEYRTDVFDASFVERMVSHFAVLLDAIANDPDTSVDRLPLLSPMERTELVETWNSRREDYGSRRIFQVFEEQAARTPDAVALVYEGRTMSYREVDERSNQLAHHLLALGVKIDDLVGISAERSFELVIGILGILKSGAGYAPIDPENPRDRVEFMLEDAGVTLLVTEEKLRAQLPLPSRCQLVLVDAHAPEIAQRPKTSPKIVPPPNALAYVVYTSGSTGKPKAAMNSHAAVANRLAWQQQTFQLTANDCLIHKTAIGFDLAVWEALWPIMVGARVVLVRAGGQRDLAHQVELIRENKITLIHLMPSVIPIFVDLAGFDDWGASIRQVVTGGEALSVETQERFFARSKANLANYYGPSECAVDVTGWLCERNGKRATVPIGRPLANVAVYILDRNMEVVPVGVPGELCVGGVAVGRGYHRRPDLTAEKFIPDPFSGKSSARLYRTGDLVRWAEDGTIEFLGRIDNQVKLRGFRIELGEIESAIAEHPAVKSVVVIVREDSPGNKQLVAYLTVDAELSVDDAKANIVPAIKKKLQAQLPEHMVPAMFMVLPKMPVTSSGKIDRRALPAPERGRDASVAYVEPRTPLETRLAEMWSELLRVPRVGLDDNFFTLGGHSLLAMRLIAKIREQLLVDTPVRALFEAPTLGPFAERVSSSVPVAPSEPIERLPRGPDVVFPLSYEQESYWRWERANPGTTTWNGPAAFEIKGPVDVDSLLRAVAEIVRRHESLRTHFPIVDGKPVQKIDERPHETAIIDLRPLDDEARAARLDEIIREENETLIDLARGPLFRTRLVRLRDDEVMLFVLSHHCVVGGRWFDVLTNELRALYAAFVAGKPSPLRELAFQYADYAVWYRRRVEGPALAKRVAHWQQKLEGAQLTLLPGETAVTDSKPTLLRNYAFSPPPGTMDAIQALAKREQVTPFMIVLASVAVLLHRHTGQEDLVIGAPTDRRSDTPEEAEQMIALFTTHVLYRISLAGKPTFKELLQRVKRVLLEATEHEIPLMAIFQVDSPLDHPFMRVACNFMVATGANAAPEAQPELPVHLDSYGGMPERRRNRKDCLLFLLGRGPDRLSGRVLFPEGLMDVDAGQTFVAEHARWLASLVNEPDQACARPKS